MPGLVQVADPACGVAALLEVADVSVRFGGVQALKGVSLEVPAGQLTGLIGPNGAGKTTLIDSISGLNRYTGSISMLGRDVTRMAPHALSRLGIRRTFQSVELINELTVRENLHVYADGHGFGASTANPALVDEALRRVGVGWTRDLFPDELPHGTRRLVSIARALVGESTVLLLDEPAAGLEAEETEELGRRLRSLLEEGTTVLLVDHDMDLVLRYCDTVHVLRFGELLMTGTPDEVRSNRKVIEAYLGDEAAG